MVLVQLARLVLEVEVVVLYVSSVIWKLKTYLAVVEQNFLLILLLHSSVLQLPTFLFPYALLSCDSSVFSKF